MLIVIEKTDLKLSQAVVWPNLSGPCAGKYFADPNNAHSSTYNRVAYGKLEVKSARSSEL